MRSTPPAVEVALAPGRRERLLVAALYAVAFALVGAWMASHGAVSVLIGWPVAGVLGACLGWGALQPMRGTLRWDGQGWWHGQPSGAAHPLHSVDLMMDLGGWMLLRVRAEPVAGRLLPGRWCGVGRTEAGAGWHGLRLALYHGAGAAADVAPDRASG
jgi:hypothetical protein